jgi:hypothetical protein
MEFNMGRGDSGNSQAFGEYIKQVDPGTCVPKLLRQKHRINGNDHAGMTPMQIW